MASIRLAPAGAAALAILLGASAAAADAPPSFTLDWRASGDCPSAVEVRQQIERLLASSAGGADTVQVRARVERVDSRHRVTIETRAGDRQRRRVIEAPSCREVADATAVLVALVIDPELAEAMAMPGSAPSPDAGAHAAPVTAPTPAAAPAREATRAPTRAAGARAPAPRRARASGSESGGRWVFGVSGALAGDAGTMPSVAMGGGAAATAARGRFLGELRGAYWPSRARELAGHPGAGGDIDLVVAGVAACWRARLAPPELAACGGVEVDHMRGDGFGVDRPSAGSATWLGVAAGGRAAWPLSQVVAIQVGLDAVVPTARPWFFLDGLGRLHRTSPAAARLSAGAALRF